ncbi:hypothetical protein PFMG_00670 [Plasmodium falciparum IGH-CR14]|uniref:Uncharacterized protein n=1 Tax=Plasmodium falciparum IGH-CR14 TaxID=580059 RepID=A0A0L1I4L4_PLAFA|nr:hypothetical protein PFMG_00670 [Plasmodium falciparum IGH-CR14]
MTNIYVYADSLNLKVHNTKLLELNNHEHEVVYRIRAEKSKRSLYFNQITKCCAINISQVGPEISCEIYVLILSRFFFFFSTTTFIYECLHPKRKGGNEGRIVFIFS